jgi:hypothetical protein
MMMGYQKTMPLVYAFSGWTQRTFGPNEDYDWLTVRDLDEHHDFMSIVVGPNDWKNPTHGEGPSAVYDISSDYVQRYLTAAPMSVFFINGETSPLSGARNTERTYAQMFLYNFNGLAYVSFEDRSDRTSHAEFALGFLESLWLNQSISSAFSNAINRMYYIRFLSGSGGSPDPTPFIIRKWQSGNHHKPVPSHDPLWDHPLFYSRITGGDMADEPYDDLGNNDDIRYNYYRDMVDVNNATRNSYNSDGAVLVVSGKIRAGYVNETVGWCEYPQGPNNAGGTINVSIRYWEPNQMCFLPIPGCYTYEGRIENNAMKLNWTQDGGELWYIDYDFGGTDMLSMYMNASVMQTLGRSTTTNRYIKVTVSWTTSDTRESILDPEATQVGIFLELHRVEIYEVGTARYIP